MELNSKLAEGRKSALKKAIDTKFPDMPAGVINYSHEDENWSGFINAINGESFEDELLEIINGESDLDRREQKLLSSKYRSQVIDICNNLRNCSIEMRYKAPKSIEKEGEFAPNMVSGGFTSSSNLNIPSDIYTQNSMMLEYMNKNDYAKAFAVYQKMDTKAPAVSNNIGVLLTFLGDYPMAKYYFDQAKCVESHDYNLGTMYLHAGDYAAAADAFGEVSSPNAVIANLAAKRYDMAAKLACSGEYESAEMIYLRAVSYTYTESDEIVLSTLAKACELDPKYREYAKSNQAEFIPFRVLPAFKKIVK